MAVHAPSAGAIPERSEARARAVNIVRWLLIGVLVMDVLNGMVTLPRKSSLAGLQRDLAAGNVQSVTFASANDLGAVRLLGGELMAGRRDGDIVLWRTGTLRYRSARMTEGLRGFPSEALREAYGTARREQVTALARLAGVPVRPHPGNLQRIWSLGQFLPFMILLVTLFLAGQPRRATRWATFWLFLLPLNAGLILTLFRETPWSRQARESREPLPHKLEQHGGSRTTAGHAFLFVLVACALGLALAGVVA